VPDPRKGEALLLVTTRQNADGREVLAAARARMIPEIMVPRAVLSVPSVPLLGTGKVDYPAVQRLVEASRVSAEAALV
jgi:acyl-[acyl-carrier-protein]-phospholipid O-acyltransferase/long-chain-fatty-acid--[acyl-carrier-protein] ligase